MKRCLFFFLVVSSHLAVSQDINTVYYNSKWEITSMKDATYYRHSGFEPSTLHFDSIVTDYYMNGAIEMQGKYNKGKKEGQFIYYYPNHEVRLITNYSNHKRSGVWTSFYENGLKDKVVEYIDGKEKLIESNDQNGNMILKNLTGKYSFDLVYNYSFPAFSQVHLDQQSGKYIISGKFSKGSKTGKWEIKKDDKISFKVNNDWETSNVVSRAFQFKYKNGILIKGWEYKFNSKSEINIDTLTYLIPEPEKIKITESLFCEPGQMIRQNYVIKAMLDLKAKSTLPVELEDETEFKDFFDLNFSKYIMDCSKSIWLTINLKYDENGSISVNSINPRASPVLEKEVYRIVALISKIKNHSPSNLVFSYRIHCLDELDYK
jgi:antitoxin component YwqK of YwqJK toxin-antitoxin module